MFPNQLWALESSLPPAPTEDSWLASLLLKDIHEDFHNSCLQILSKSTKEGKMEKLLIILHSISFIKGC